MQRLKTEEEERKRKKTQKSKKAQAKGIENDRKQKRLFEEDLCSVGKEDEPPCDLDEEGDIDWVGREKCHRWYHVECVDNYKRL